MLIFEILFDIQVSMSTRQEIEYEVWENIPLENHQYVGVKTTRDHFNIWLKSNDGLEKQRTLRNTDV